MSPFIPLGTKLNPKLDSMSQTASEDDKSRDNELPEKLDENAAEIEEDDEEDEATSVEAAARRDGPA